MAQKVKSIMMSTRNNKLITPQEKNPKPFSSRNPQQKNLFPASPKRFPFHQAEAPHLREEIAANINIS